MRLGQPPGGGIWRSLMSNFEVVRLFMFLIKCMILFFFSWCRQITYVKCTHEFVEV